METLDKTGNFYLYKCPKLAHIHIYIYIYIYIYICVCVCVCWCRCVNVSVGELTIVKKLNFYRNTLI